MKKALLLIPALFVLWSAGPRAQAGREVLSPLDCRMLADTFTKVGGRMKLAEMAKLRHCLTRLIFEKRRESGTAPPALGGADLRRGTPALKRTVPGKGAAAGVPGVAAPPQGPPAGAQAFQSKKLEALKRRMRRQGNRMKARRPQQRASQARGQRRPAPPGPRRPVPPGPRTLVPKKEGPSN